MTKIGIQQTRQFGLLKNSLEEIFKGLIKENFSDLRKT